jgi:hypothetical protein
VVQIHSPRPLLSPSNSATFMLFSLKRLRRVFVAKVVAHEGFLFALGRVSDGGKMAYGFWETVS